MLASQRKMIKCNGIRTRRVFAFAILLALGFVASSPAYAFTPQSGATLSVGSATGTAGSNVNLSVSLAPGSASIGTLQLDLQFASPLAYVSIATGSAAAAAQKSASANPISGGLRVLVFGLNVNPIGSGPVAVVTLSIASGAPGGTIPITITNITASDPGGTQVPVAGVNGSVTVQGSGDTTPPTISAVSSPIVTSSGATITWTTNEASDSQVEYGTTAAYGSSTTLNPAMVTSHSQPLSGLAAATVYHYRVKSRDAAGNLAQSGDHTFTTAGGTDTTPPVISGVASSNISSSGATILWATNEASNSEVEYGITTSYGSSTAVIPALVTTHSQALSGLVSNTTYHFRVKSRDGAGNQSTSNDFTFKTSQAGTGGTIYNIVVSDITWGTATISWYSGSPGNAQILYGTTPDCDHATSIYNEMTTSHSIPIFGLHSSTTYYYRVKTDIIGAVLLSDPGTFQTPSYGRLRLVYPRLATKAGGTAAPAQGEHLDDSEYMGIAIANLGDVDAVLTFTARDQSGAQINGENIVNPVTQTLPPGAQLAMLDVELFGGGLPARNPVGWIDIDSSIDAITAFTLTFNASLTMMDGAPLSGTPLTQFVFSEIEDQGFTDLNVANPNQTPGTVTFQLVQGDGTTRASAVRTVNAYGAVVESVASLFPGVAPDPGSYVRAASDAGMIPFALLGRAEQDVEGLNGLPTDSGATTLYCPQYAVGGAYRSTLSIVNLDDAFGTVTLRLFGDNGTQIGATRIIPVAGRGKVYINDQFFFVGPGSGPVQGYLDIRSNGPRIAGNVVFGDPAQRTFVTALPLVSRSDSSFVFSQVASDPTYFMGIALLNPNDATAQATVSLYADNGNLAQTVTVTLPGKQRITQLLDQLIPALAGQSINAGYIRVTSDRQLAGFSVFGTRDLKTLSAVPPQFIR